MHSRKNFIPQDRTAFLCTHCGAQNADDQPSPRNHCRFCLFSVHVDETVPGDRESPCGGLMAPIGVSSDPRKGYVLTHQCRRCKKEMNNKSAADDDTATLIHISASSAHRSMST